MDGEFEEFEEVDDEFLGALPLDDLVEQHNQQIDRTAAQQTQGQASSVSAAASAFIPLTTTVQIDKVESESINAKSDEQVVEIPEKFPFPFEPYDIQQGFMENLYKALVLGKIGIFESPTGTGKSLSLICGALQWLRDYEENEKQELEALLALTASKEQDIKTEPESDWIAAFVKKKEIDQKANKIKEEQDLFIRRQARLERLKSSTKHVHRAKRKREALDDQFDELFRDAAALKSHLSHEMQNDNEGIAEGQLDEDLILAEYFSDEDDKKKDETDDDDDVEEHVTKIYYCSRTHSQLAQFVREIQKSSFDDMRVVSLGSRQNLCINDTVRKLSSLSMINEQCLEMQKNKKASKADDAAEPSKKRKKKCCCPYYKNENVQDFRDQTMLEVYDIEQLVKVGRQKKACPYYGTRLAIPAAQLVALPYNTMLHKSTRESCGIKLKGNVVIIDEAHNLMETISNVYSAQVTGAQLTLAHSQLSQYQQRYCSRLKAKNLLYVRQILFILSGFIKILGGKMGIPADKQSLPKSECKLRTINNFLVDCKIDNLNMFKVKRYCERSQISRKLHGFSEKYQPQVLLKEEKKESENAANALSKFLKEVSESKDGILNNNKPVVELPEVQETTTFTSPLMNIESFLDALTNCNKDGRIVINRQDLLSKSSLRFLLLNPAVYFADVVSEARAIIVAGGTMEPVSDFKDQLLYNAGVSSERILHYSCGHVIPAENLLPMVMARGSSGQQLDFTYQQRDQPQMIEELGRVVYNVCHVVPGGVVCFFPSYEYERRVYQHWESSGFINKISSNKKIFREPKKASQVDQVLREYSSFIKNHIDDKSSAHTGCLLLCVVGGKMSEGINFSDELGRCVMMVGLPYPNLHSPELKEKMNYLNVTMPKNADGKMPGQLHYESLCMKAVNQSIGRAIRHKGDYACILLLDYRYLRPAVTARLPSWIKDHMQKHDHFGPAFNGIRQFFAAKKAS